MGKASRTRQWWWRWRSNPLRRRTDIVEAWIVLAVWTVIALGGTLAGLATAHAAEESFTLLRRERHSVPAVLAESTSGAVPTGEGTESGQVRAKVRWSASDGSTRTGRTMVDSGHRAGSKVVIWMNGQGQLTAEPPAENAAAAEASLLGGGAALAFAGLTFAAGRLAQWRLDQRRYEQWSREWETVGPQWGRKGT
ncbi:Rv1733c family protein [Streptomyces cellulosae]|uniref:Membrane protein SCJ1.26 n=1 Tax=Streptomyces cellulosae TaxID=1968 RepID=A0ABW7Y104_STRCE